VSLIGPDCEPLVVALVAIHDIGKWSIPFGSLIADERIAGMRHDEAGLWLWRERLADLHPDGLGLLPLARGVFGHHGTPVAEENQPRLLRLYGVDGIAAAEAFAHEVFALIAPEPVTVRDDLTAASFFLSGLTVAADWLGSSQAAFPYHRPVLSIADYWRTVALPRARAAVEAAGVIPVPSADVQSFPDLTGIAGFRPSPTQAWAESVEISDEPALYIIEDATGSGKTEAALMLAHRLIAGGHADGIYVALPTSATSDGMYERMAVIYRHLFAAGLPSLVLAHGGRNLHNEFRRSIFDPRSDSYCAQWISDDRRAAFLAQVGVGTVDQALLAVLPSKHQSLRLFGLAQRVLIIDEAHAYDAYMSQELETLLRFHRALGGSAIVLSATLPADTRRRLLATYGGTESTSNAYPLVTATTGATTIETATEPRPDTVRSIPIELVSTPEIGLSMAVTAAAAGQAVLYIRNSVADAIEAFRAVPSGINVSLFHARFAACDRAAIQTAALTTFGKASTFEQRAGRLLIATQVVEQSLDLDFDLIVSDLAPVDLIIQRAGRLWRHSTRERPGRAERRMIVVSPDPRGSVTEGWLSDTLSRTSRVYGCDARLWLTADVLMRTGSIDAPGGLRAMIEHVYAEIPTVPAALEKSLLHADGRAGAHRGFAVTSTLSLCDGYVMRGPWVSDERAVTRLGLPTTTLRLATIENDRVVPWAARLHPGETERRLWAMSELKVPIWTALKSHIEAHHVAAVEMARADWSDWEKSDHHVLILEPTGDAWAGQVENQNGIAVLTYCDRIGARAD
jgi:CRISPR-associated endonuclease/helicase Cas3